MMGTWQRHSLGGKTAALLAAALLVLTSAAPVASAQSSYEEVSMESGQVYELPVEFLEADGSGVESSIAGYFAETALVVCEEDGSYDVLLALEDVESAIEIVIEDHEIEVSDDGTFLAITDLENVSDEIEVLATAPALGEDTVEALVAIDLSSLAVDETDTAQTLSTESSESAESSDGETVSTLSTSSTTFEVGHTYSVPMEFLKENSSETSMSDQYFGDAAYVRPQSDGTMEVSFSTNSTDYISGITYNGSAVSLSGTTFTLTIDYSESDVVIPLGLTVVPMQELGMGEVMADLHLYMSQATDLGTNVTGNPDSGEAPATDPTSDEESDTSSSSTSSLAKTNDQSMVAAGVAAVLAVAGAAMIGSLVHIRRRDGR